MARGESFLALDAPLLAGLHFDRALELDPGCAAAARHKESLRRSISRESAPAPHAPSAGRNPSGCCGDGQEKRFEVTDGAGDGSPAPAEDGAVFSTVDEMRKQGAVTAVAAIGSSPRGEGGGGIGTGISTGGRVSAKAFRRAVAAACENYRAGVVLHQEAFLCSSTEKFLRVLELLEIASAKMTAAVVPQGLEAGEPGDGRGEERVRVSPMDGGEGESFDRDRSAGLGAEFKTWSSFSSGESLNGGSEVVRSMRVGCHLNIAAAFLLRKTDFESAVGHCTRYATWRAVLQLAVFPPALFLASVRKMTPTGHITPQAGREQHQIRTGAPALDRADTTRLPCPRSGFTTLIATTGLGSNRVGSHAAHHTSHCASRVSFVRTVSLSECS